MYTCILALPSFSLVKEKLFHIWYVMLQVKNVCCKIFVIIIFINCLECWIFFEKLKAVRSTSMTLMFLFLKLTGFEFPVQRLVRWMIQFEIAIWITSTCRQCHMETYGDMRVEYLFDLHVHVINFELVKKTTVLLNTFTYSQKLQVLGGRF